MSRKHLAKLLVAGIGAAASAFAAQNAYALNNAINDITWSFGPDLPALRKGGAIGVVNGTVVYASGGQDGVVFQTDTTYGYVPGAASWTNLPNMPQSRAYLDGTTVNDAMYAVAGRIGGMAGSTVSTIFRLRYENNAFTWDTLPQQMNRTRAFYTLGKLGTKVYAVGGARFTNNNPVDFWDRQVKDADTFDTANPGAGSQALPDLPGVARLSPVTAGVAGKLYVFGGTNIGAPGAGYDSDRLNDAYRYDPATNSWSSIPALPFGYSGGHASVYKDRFIILTGGVGEFAPDDGFPMPQPGYYNNMVMVYDTRLQTYDILPTLLPEATNDIRTVMIGDKLYAVGGETGSPTFNSSRLRVGQIQFGPGEWDADASASWNDSASWSTTVPNGVGSFANFLAKITSPRNVTLNAPVTAGYVTLQNTNAYTITGTSTLTLQTAGGEGFISISSGNHSILAPMRMVSAMKVLGPGTLTTGAITNNATLTLQTTVVAGKIDGAGRLVLPSNRSLSAAGVTQDFVDLSGTLSISAGRSTGKTSVIKSLNLAPGARFDLNDNDLILNYSGASPFSTVRSQIIAGYANGTWNGSGIISGAAAASGPVKMALGYAEATSLSLGTFSGQSLDGTAILVRYTAAGDANLDGTVDSHDFGRFIAGYGQASNAIWINGDFDYNGKVNAVDFNLLAGSFGTSIASPGLGSVVPEPAGAAAIAFLSLSLLIRRPAV